MEIERTLTKIKDIDLKILSKLDERSILEFCKTSKYGRELCKNEDFWRNMFISKISDDAVKNKPENVSWKKYYLKTIINLEEVLNILRNVVIDDIETSEEYKLIRADFVNYSFDALYIIYNLMLKFLKQYDERTPEDSFLPRIFQPFNLNVLGNFEYKMKIPGEWKGEAMKRGRMMLEDKYEFSVAAIGSRFPSKREIETEELLKFIIKQKLIIPDWEEIYLSGVLDYLLNDLIEKLPSDATSKDINEIIQNTKLIQSI